ncbi:MAG TPA: ABC transporter permease [Streptosporangiaceae bacterium]|nr:ABC transporter permease [Streptosporangiaceae bacterium]
MIRFAWIRFRTQALVAFGALAVLAVILVVTGIQLAHAYDTIIAICKPDHDCASALSSFPSNGYLSASNGMHPLVIAVPCVLGMFWGAPLAAREFETGTFRLAWTQGVTRTRWLAVKLAVVGLVSMTVAGLLSLMMTWWSSPIAEAQMGARLDPSIFSESGIAPVGYAAFAFAFGVTAGLLSRRTLPAMAVTLAIFVAVVWFAFPVWVRPHFLPPAQTSTALSMASVTGSGSSFDGRALFLQTAPPDLPGAWVLSSQVTTPAGRLPSTEPATAACGPNQPSDKSCRAYIESLHLRQTVTYQPASRYWPLQWIETGIYLAFALLLAGLCFLRIRPGRPGQPDIPRPSRLAPELERSP